MSTSFTLEIRAVQKKPSAHQQVQDCLWKILSPSEKVDDYIEVKEILLEMGIYFQVQDDYLDCFGDPEKIGKKGTNIQNYKCSWLVVKALEICNKEQKKLLCNNYGKADLANVAVVKSRYNDLNLQDVFAEYEIEVGMKIRDRIEALPSKAVQSVLKGYLAEICKRKKQGTRTTPAATAGDALVTLLIRKNCVQILQSKVAIS